MQSDDEDFTQGDLEGFLVIMCAFAWVVVLVLYAK